MTANFLSERVNEQSRFSGKNAFDFKRSNVDCGHCSSDGSAHSVKDSIGLSESIGKYPVMMASCEPNGEYIATGHSVVLGRTGSSVADCPTPRLWGWGRCEI